MRAEFFDFETGRWNLDLSAMDCRDGVDAAPRLPEPEVSDRVEFDKT